MRVRIVQDHSLRISSGVSRQFRANSDVSIPRNTAEALIAAGVAEPLGGDKQQPSKSKEK